MVHPIRIEYHGAVYHIISRGNQRQHIFRASADCARSRPLLVRMFDPGCTVRRVLVWKGVLSNEEILEEVKAVRQELEGKGAR